MQKLPLLASLFAGLASISAQTYTFTTWAGGPAQGYADGVGRAALFNEPRDVAIDGSGNLFVADTGNHVIRKVTPDGVVSTFAGVTQEAGSEDGNLARFTYPSAITVDRAGNVYVADNASVIRKVTPDGWVTTLAGRSGERGNADGRGSAARFRLGNIGQQSSYYATGGGLASDGDGNIYVADTGNGTIRKVTPDGVVTTIAGSAGQFGDLDGNRETARFLSPLKLAVDSAGNLYVTNDTEKVRKISPNGDVTTLAQYHGVYGVAADSSGSLFALQSAYFPNWADFGENGGAVFRISPSGAITPVAGSDSAEVGSQDGPGDVARFFNPRGFTLGPTGEIFVADTGNHAIRKISANRVVTTVAGDSPVSVDARGRAARFRSPDGMTIDPAGNVYVSDRGAIRKISPAGVVTTLASAVTRSSVYGGGIYLAVDGSGNVLVTDYEFLLTSLRKVSPTGVVTTVVTFDPGASPIGLAADRTGNVFLTSLDHAVRKITPEGKVTILAGSPGVTGSADGIGAAARFLRPRGIAVNSRGDLFVAEWLNHSIRMISSDGVVTTVAGVAGQRGRKDGVGSAARFSYPTGIAVDSADNIFVIEDNNVYNGIFEPGAIRKITDGIVTTVPAVWNDGAILSSAFAVDASGAFYMAKPFPYCAVSKGTPLSTDAGSHLVTAVVRANLRDQQPLVAGFDLRGSARPVLLRAIGPGLEPFVADVPLAGDPRLILFDRSGAVGATNDNWGGTPDLTAAFASAGAFPLAANSADAALVSTLSGQGTAQVASPTGGMAWFELFDTGPAATSGIANFSSRHVVGGDTFTVGFTIEGGAKTVLIRGIGPTLAAAPFNVRTALRLSQLTVLNGTGEVIAGDSVFQNLPAGPQVLQTEDWPPGPLQAIFTRAGAFPLQLASGNRAKGDAALLLTLQPGSYSAILSGVGGAVGDALLEIYEVP